MCQKVGFPRSGHLLQSVKASKKTPYLIEQYEHQRMFYKSTLRPGSCDAVIHCDCILKSMYLYMSYNATKFTHLTVMLLIHNMVYSVMLLD